MKRAFLRKVKIVSCSSGVGSTQVGESGQTPSGARRRARTSAAMVGLALSMGATGLLAPRQGDSAGATESKLSEVTPSSVFHLATPQGPDTELAAASLSGVETIDYVVRPGQSLKQIAERYRLSVELLAATNNLAPTATLKTGQILKLPLSATEASKLLELADLSRLSPSSDSSIDQNQRTQAFDRLQQQREKLKNSLAELRRGESIGLIADAGVGSASSKSVVQDQQPQALLQLSNPANPDKQISPSPVAVPSPTASPTVAALPVPASGSNSSDLDWMRVNQSLVVSSLGQAQVAKVPLPQPKQTVAALPQPTELAEPAAAVDLAAYQVNSGDTVAQIARAHNIPQSALIAANHLNDPNVIFVGQVLKLPETQQVSQVSGSINPPVNPPMPSVLPISTAEQPVSPSPVELPTVPQQNSQSVAVVPSSILPAPSVAPDSSRLDVGTETAGRNPYVQNLLSEIKALRQQRSAPEPVAAVLTSATAPSAAVNPSNSQPMQPVAAQALRSRLGATAPAVVATAPLGSENYEPLMKPLTGRMVSPELPSLPNADHFLPDGMTTGYIWPAKGVLTSGYGWRWGRMHQGIDIASDIGTPVHAAAGGVIQYAGWNSGGYGNMIEIRHADGSMTRYAHLNAIFVHQGQEVNQGEQIAEMGSTGYSTGPHLHFEVHPNGGSAVNPMAYLPAK